MAHEKTVEVCGQKITMTLEVAFETAMTDAINIFVRTVLKVRGLLSQEAFEEIGSKEILESKYKITRELARDWAKMMSQE